MTALRAPFTIIARPSSGEPDLDVPVVGLTTFDKTFTGAQLTGTSVVWMVSALGAQGPLAYVALERVDGSLDGRAGSFVLRHQGSVVEGVPMLTLDVVPGSATGELAGLTGQGTIDHSDGTALVLEYLLPD